MSGRSTSSGFWQFDSDPPRFGFSAIKCGYISVRLRAYPDRVYRSTLIYPQLDGGNPNRADQNRIAKSGRKCCGRTCYADVEITTGTEAPVVTVSSSAVIDSGERQIVLLDKGAGRFDRAQ